MVTCEINHWNNFEIISKWFYFSFNNGISWSKATFNCTEQELCLSMCLCMCMCVWMLNRVRGTNRNRCTKRLVILHAQTYSWTLIAHSKPKPGQSDLFYGSKSKIVGVNRHWTSHPMGCLFCFVTLAVASARMLPPFSTPSIASWQRIRFGSETSVCHAIKSHNTKTFGDFYLYLLVPDADWLPDVFK